MRHFALSSHVECGCGEGNCTLAGKGKVLWIYEIRVCFLWALISSFVWTQIFSFINEAPGLLLYLSVHTQWDQRLYTIQFCNARLYYQSRLTLEKMSPVSLDRLLSSSTREEKLFSSTLWGMSNEHSSRSKIIYQEHEKHHSHSTAEVCMKADYHQELRVHYQLSEDCGQDGAA